jgi:DNA mismatch endonuclease (patch repair protein)
MDLPMRLSDLPFASSDGVRRRMQAIGSQDTLPELRLRGELWSRGLRYRVGYRPIPNLNRRADIVFPREKVACFVDGCFWHGCPEHGSRAWTVNNWYWPDKIARNRLRDQDTTRKLVNLGWCVVRVWEHEDPERAAREVAGLVISRRPA